MAEDIVGQAVDGVVDGTIVDWPALQGLARSDDERTELKWLQVLGQLANLHRSGPAVGRVTDTNATTMVPVTAPAGTVGSDWGHYQLRQRLGSGGFGSVYSAWDPQLERHVAIKILHQQVDDDALRQRLLREGRALARIRHPNVVQVLGVEAHGNRVGLCMELVSGETLGDALRERGLMSHREAVIVGAEVSRALAAVHAAGYVHRDVKAQNVMRDDTGKIVLMDFGTGYDLTRDRRAQDRVGTPVYMAPEVLRGEAATVQSDVYAVGVLLYHLVSRHYPVEGTTLAELKEAHEGSQRHPLIERRPDLPLPFVNVVSRALAPDPAERWPSAAALLEALEATPQADTTTWARTAVMVAACAAAGVVGITILGMVGSRFFNDVLGRESFVNEGPRDWLYWGAVSAVAPLILVLMVLLGLSLLRSTVRVVLRLWPGARRMVDAVLRTGRRLELDDVESVAAMALLASVAIVAGACWLVRGDIAALWRIVPNISSAPLEAIAYLSPAHVDRHTTYRLVFEWATIALAVVWWTTFKLAGRRGQSIAGVVQLGAAALFLLTLLLLEFPYRLLYQANFDVVQWNERRCYVLGERGDEYLLFCPDLDPPRSQPVKKNASGLSSSIGPKANPFTNTSIFPVERP